MKVKVTYNNPKTGEHEIYDCLFDDLLEEFNGLLDQAELTKSLTNTGSVTIENGFATTFVQADWKFSRDRWQSANVERPDNHVPRPDCTCKACLDIDWDEKCANCEKPQRQCCGCHAPEHIESCDPSPFYF